MEWISVKDRLPENHNWVLLICAKMLPTQYTVGHYQPNQKSWYKEAFGLPDKMITHWMPLPEPPKEKKES